MPMSGDFSTLARSSSSAVWTSTSTAMPQSIAASSSSTAWSSETAGEDDEDAVGAEGAAISTHLPGIVEEVLAQHRQRAGVAGEAEVAVVALEARAVGQHAEAGGAAGGVGGGERGRVEVGADQALRTGSPS